MKHVMAGIDEQRTLANIALELSREPWPFAATWRRMYESRVARVGQMLHNFHRMFEHGWAGPDWPANPNIPRRCNGCGAVLLLENLFVDDGCPCNTPRGVNFQPIECGICPPGWPCVKPGHRLKQLFGIGAV